MEYLFKLPVLQSSVAENILVQEVRLSARNPLTRFILLEEFYDGMLDRQPQIQSITKSNIAIWEKCTISLSPVSGTTGCVRKGFKPYFMIVILVLQRAICDI